ncbi:glycoside hydrolase family 47 protein [Streptomyces sp. NBC_01262]|uniref:glycoside hydrolase family 47 protein n=1 Tax=Streptomyces sp. NBC_01262 TaxID=2903803 RepID=UPI002E322B43|nr:glycoside hydrolase family 47 protein [Streptomyces sp. NBC_01262]
MTNHARPGGLTRRRMIGGLASITPAVAMAGTAAGTASAAAPDPYPALGADVVKEFRTAWDSYRRLAWGRDELRPVSGSGSDFFIPGGTLGLTIIEALDTLYLMELDSELNAGVEWVRNDLRLDQNAPVQVFEAIIRLVGGLLSAYAATKDRMLLDRARELADRLLPAFHRSPTGAPYRYVNLSTGEVRGTEAPLAEIGTCIAEFGELSRITGDRKYFDAAKKALKAVYDRRSRIDLVGTTLNVETGAWAGRTATLDPPVDSFYEYLWDGWTLFGDHDLKAWYDKLTAAVLKRLAERRAGRLWFRQADMTTGKATGHNQSELTAFYAGLLAQSGHLADGERYHDAWTAVLGKFRLPPEYLDYRTMKAVNPAYPLRPEYADSCLFLWLATGKDRYRARARDLYSRQKRHCKVANGYTVVDDVTASPMRLGDLTPGYWYSENMKYYYLLFAKASRFDYTDNYLSTEGNVLKGLR